MLLAQRSDAELERPGSLGALEDDANVLRINLPDDDAERTVIGFIGFRADLGGWWDYGPVRLPGLRPLESYFGIFQPDQGNRQRRPEQRERIETQLEVPHFEQIRRLGPVGIFEADTLSDDDRLASEIDIEAAFDDEFPAGFFRDPAFELRFEYARISKPQEEQHGHH